MDAIILKDMTDKEIEEINKILDEQLKLAEKEKEGK